MRVIVTTAVLTGAMAFSGLLAQATSQSAEMALQISAAQKKNAAAVRQYSWKRRVEIQKGGETKKVTLKLVRFDMEGKLEATTIGGTEPPKKKHGIRGRVQKKKQAGAKDTAEEVVKITQSYIVASPGTLVDFFQKATFDNGKGELSDTIKIRGRDFAREGDSVIMWVDATTHQLRKLEFHTVLEEDRMDGIIDYKTLEDGLNYAARVVIKIPARELRTVLEHFDYERQG